MSMPQAGNDAVLHCAIAAGSGWQAVWEVLARGWSWTVVPPLLVAFAAVIGAYRSLRTDAEKWADAQQERRHREELHQLELMRARGELALEALPPRS